MRKRVRWRIEMEGDGGRRIEMKMVDREGWKREDVGWWRGKNGGVREMEDGGEGKMG